MSEKRFTLRTNSVSTNYPSGRIFDNKKQHTLYLDEIVDLLNELSDENNILNKNEDDLKECTIENIKLQEENVQLRQILKDIVGATDETYTKNTNVFKVTVVLDYEKYGEIRECIE
jgi:hypothetical protein